MTLNLDNIGAIRLVPYGENRQAVYGFPSELSVSTPSGNGTVDYGHRGQGYGMLVKNWTEGRDIPILDFDGMVYLPGAKIVAPDGESFSDGGYLGTVPTSFRFVSYARDQTTVLADETVTIDSLGVIPAQYSGGAIIDNLNVTSGVWEEGAKWLGDKYHKEYSGHTLDWNGDPVWMINWVVVNGYRPNTSARTRLTCVERGLLGREIDITLRTLPLSSS